MLFDVILGVVALLFLLVSSYSDLRSREVPDLLSYGLIFTALGLRAIFSFYQGWEVLLSGVFGFSLMFLIGWLLYKTNLWGGGDSKLLMGMGAVIGISYPFSPSSLTLLWFFVALLFLGSIYGFIWIVALSVSKWSRFRPLFVERLQTYRKAHLVLGSFSAAVLGISVVSHPLWLLLLFPLAIFYLFLFVTTIEDHCFVKRISPLKLTEGDWLDEEVVVDDDHFPRRKALEKRDVEYLQSAHSAGKLPSVVIREGVPFVPSFVFAYLVIFLGSDLALQAAKTFLGLGSP